MKFFPKILVAVLLAASFVPATDCYFQSRRSS